MTKEKLLKSVPLQEYFKERVGSALKNQRIPASDLLEFYIVNMLQEFRKTEKLFEKVGTEMTEQPLALLLAKAVEGNTQNKIRCLKKLGDTSLYTAGFFSDRVRKKSTGITYYIRMGGSAYNNLSGLLNNEKTFSTLYAELSQLFPHLIDVLGEVATTTHWTTHKDLLKLYEKWLSTGDGRIEKLLNDEGIQTQESSFNKVQ